MSSSLDDGSCYTLIDCGTPRNSICPVLTSSFDSSTDSSSRAHLYLAVGFQSRHLADLYFIGRLSDDFSATLYSDSTSANECWTTPFRIYGSQGLDVELRYQATAAGIPGLPEDLFISANHCEYDLIGIGTHLTDASQNYDSRVTVENETQQSVVGITYVRSVCGIAERLWPNIPSHALYTTHLNHQRVEDLDPRVHDVYQQSGYAFSPHDTEAKPLSCRIRLTRLQASNVVTIAQQLPGSTLMPYVSRGEYTLEELQERHSAVIYKSLN